MTNEGNGMYLVTYKWNKENDHRVACERWSSFQEAKIRYEAMRKNKNVIYIWISAEIQSEDVRN